MDRFLAVSGDFFQENYLTRGQFFRTFRRLFLKRFSACGQLFGSFGRLFLGDFSARGQFFGSFRRLGRLRLAYFKFLGTPNLPACNTGFAKLGQIKLGSTFAMLFIFCTFTQQQVFNVPNFSKPKTVGCNRNTEIICPILFETRTAFGLYLAHGHI